MELLLDEQDGDGTTVAGDNEDVVTREGTSTLGQLNSEQRRTASPTAC